jgi:tripartite-type tricarboxylate transporter receptor subunit TctC
MTWRARCAWSSPSRQAGGGARLTVRRALESPELRQRLVQLGTEPSPSTPAELGALLRDDLAKWGKVIRENNIKDE